MNLIIHLVPLIPGAEIIRLSNGGEYTVVVAGVSRSITEEERTAAEAAWQIANGAKVTRRQFKLALLTADLLDSVEAMIAASPDRALQIAWADALEFERYNPLVLQMATALNKTAEELDQLFAAAAEL